MGRASQIVCLTVLAAALGWSAFSTARFMAHDDIVSARNAKIYALQDEKAALQNGLGKLRTRLRIQEQSLTATQKSTVDLLADNQELQFHIAGLEKRLSDEIERGRAFALSYLGEVEAHARDQVVRERLEVERQKLRSTLADRNAYLAAIDAERTRLDSEIAATNTELLRLKDEVGTLNHARVDLIGRLNETHRDLVSTRAAKLEIESERRTLGQQVAALSSRLEAIEDAHGDIVTRLAEQAGESGDALKRTLSIAGLDVDRMLERLARTEEGGNAVGGPLLPIDNSPGSNLVHQIAKVDRRIDDFQRLQDLMQRLPLTAPLDEYRVTSGYGRRIDPFTSRLAMHGGIDLVSRRRAPVHVTSPGVVTFVGWKGGFGKVVEVDHGLGIRTRYAHLSSIFVKRGQKVEFREKVGQVGSTGRSSGEHLHYEIIVDGRGQDPANFIKAGQYVFKK
ncbi:MAG: peptidoglycan DD-metalloendopeptidase family protein [Alphaproteobacteria bacterium]|nr:peptidoglycan DD-metalloendopeptidase family protein [Alphaproteobacteria bacterium]